MNYFFKRLILRIALALLSVVIEWWQRRRSLHVESCPYQHNTLSPDLYLAAHESNTSSRPVRRP